MGERVYRQFDQTELDWQYNNRDRSEHSFAGYVDFYQRQSAAVRAETDALIDAAFGDSAAETLDILRPHDRAEPLPVQIFIHGGYWRMLHKNDFSFVAGPVVDAGGMAVIVNYDLMPTVTMDELVRQCRAAVAWCWRHIAEHGGDPHRLFVSGHSAGGHLVAALMSTNWEAEFSVPGDVLKGGVAISGIFDLEPIRLGFLNEELQLDAATVRRNSPLFHVPDKAGSLIVAYGSLESEEFARQSAEYVTAWRNRGLDADLAAIDGHHHMSVVASLAHGDRELTMLLLRQMGLT
jgi:arylformamidase